jgi:hypothetical protein
MSDNDLRVGRKTALGAVAALLTATASGMQARAGTIPTMGGHHPRPLVASETAPSDVVNTLQYVINGINDTSTTGTGNPRFCSWDDVEFTLRQVADLIQTRAEKTDAWRWRKVHRACVPPPNG